MPRCVSDRIAKIDICTYMDIGTIIKNQHNLFVSQPKLIEDTSSRYIDEVHIF